MKKKFLILLLTLISFPAFSQAGSIFSAKMDFGIPLQGEPELYSSPCGTFDLRTYFYNKDNSLFQYGFNINFGAIPTKVDNETLEAFELAGLFSVYYPFSQRLNVRGDLTLGGGWYSLSNGNTEGFTEKYGPASGLNVFAGFDTIFGLYTSPNAVLNLGLGLRTSPGIYNSFNINLGYSWHIPTFPPMLTIDAVQSANILPVFYEYYNENPVFKIQVTNNERFPIKKITLRVPKTTISDKYSENILVRIKPGETKEVLIPFKLKETILENRNRYSDKLNIAIRYKAGSKSRKSKLQVNFTIMERNSFIWQSVLESDDDSVLEKIITANDGKVAVFVNPNDEKMIALSHEIQQEDDGKTVFDELSYNLKTICKVVSYLKSRNIKYQTDPNTVPYGSKDFDVDYLKFPSETLMSGYGDCDDLSILTAQLLESSGVNCAFITVPGHIYVAADSGMTEKSICSLFGDTSHFILHDGIYYLPIEVTLLKDDLNIIWSKGLDEWNDCKIENRAFYLLADAWKEFKPSRLNLIDDITLYYPNSNYKKYQYASKIQIIDIAMEDERKSLNTLSDDIIDFASVAKKEYKLGLLEDAYAHIQKAIVLNPNSSNYYNAALIAYRMNDINGAVLMLKEGAKISDSIKNKKLYSTLVSEEQPDMHVASASGNKKNKEEKRAVQAQEELEWQE